MNEGKKENKWAKVLAEAGLLDEIDDSWDLPGGDLAGAVITVEGQGGGRIPTTVSPAKRPIRPMDKKRPDDPFVGIESSASSKRRDDEVTRRVELTSKEPPAEQPLTVSNARSTAHGMPGLPFSPISWPDAEETSEAPVEDQQTKPTNPAPYARHSMAAPSSDDAEETQPVYATETEPTPVLESVSLEDDLARLQEQQDALTEERMINVCGSRISIAHSDVSGAEGATGSIVDDPVEELEFLDDDDSLQRRRREMSERYDVGDFTGALDLAEGILKEEGDNVEALQFKKHCQSVLLKMYESRIGDFTRVPELLVSNADLMWRNLDPASGFVLSRIDGLSTFEDVIDISGLPRFETCRILNQLLQDAIIR